MFYLDLYIYKFKINPNCLILQNISQPLCSTSVNVVLIFVFFQNQGLENKEKQKKWSLRTT